MLLVLLAVAAGVLAVRAAPVGIGRDSDGNCAHWADSGECEQNPTFMLSTCPASCAAAQDAGDDAECTLLVASGRCRSDVALVKCRASCFRALKRNLTEDLEGNWYSAGLEPRPLSP